MKVFIKNVVELAENLEEYLEFQEEVESGDNETLKQEVAEKIGQQKGLILANAYLLFITQKRLKELHAAFTYYRKIVKRPRK